MGQLFLLEGVVLNMRFFKGLGEQQLTTKFYQLPTEFTKDSDKEQLAYCLGATLYMPAMKPLIAQTLISNKMPNATSIIFDLEDSVGELQIYEALQNLKHTLQQLQQIQVDLPLLFVRVRNPNQFEMLTEFLGPLQKLLTGYAFPKFSLANADHYLTILQQQRMAGYNLYGLPILESKDIMLKENRLQTLLEIREKLIAHYDAILNVRIGTTDFSGFYGIRRKSNQSLYDIVVVRDCLADIFNVFARQDYPFVLSASVWEYFDSPQKENLSTVATKVRTQAVKGLINELELDRLNGLVGKTVIHPTHIDVVNAMHTVTYEEYLDAVEIINHQDGELGVKKSEYANKMNEMKPHLQWAKKIILQAHIYGVLQPHLTYEDLL